MAALLRRVCGGFAEHTRTACGVAEGVGRVKVSRCVAQSLHASYQPNRENMADHRSFRRLLWTLAILGLTLDLGSKYAVFRWLGKEPTGEYVVIPNAFRLIAQFTAEPLEAGTWREPLQAW